MFNIFRKKNEYVINACVNGVLKDIRNVNDIMFAQEIIGRGVAILPSSNQIVSPVKGKVIMVFPTNHALGIQLENGLELLIHVGIDTVKLKGEGFKNLINEGQLVEVGQPLINVDFDLVKRNGYSTETLMVITSPKDSYEIECSEFNRNIKISEIAFKIIKQ